MADKWSLYVEDGVLVADFSEGMPNTDEAFAQVNAEFEELASREGVTAHLSWLNMESALSKDVFSRAQEAAEVGREFGITKWVIVSSTIKGRALKGKVDDIDGVETHVTDDFDEAMAWATAPAAEPSR